MIDFKLRNSVICDDAINIQKYIGNEEINCLITSPPYYQLRSYDDSDTNELGHEKTVGEYIDKLVNIFLAIKPCMRKDCGIYVNIGDSYNGHRVGYSDPKWKVAKSDSFVKPTQSGIPIKSLCMVPERFALKMIENGFILRSIIIWHKINPVPSSADDRYSNSFEYMYFFTLKKDYYFNQQFTPLKKSSIIRAKYNTFSEKTNEGNFAGIDLEMQHRNSDKINSGEIIGANMKNVWQIATQPCNFMYCENCDTVYIGKERSKIIKKIEEIDGIKVKKNYCLKCNRNDGFVQHFAQFPIKLILTPIKASCPDAVCNKCGTIRKTIYEKQGISSYESIKEINTEQFNSEQGKKQSLRADRECFMRQVVKKNIECNCENKEILPGIVIDPFFGSGTTGRACKFLGRDFVGFEKNPKYAKMAHRVCQESYNQVQKELDL